MRPLDPRLLRYASAARTFLVGGAVLGLLQTLTVISFAWFLSQSIVGALDGRPVAELSGLILGLAITIVVRMLLVWLLEVAASRGAAQVKSQLRARVLDALAERGPDWVAGQQGARLSTVVTSGLDALDNYFARYLPQLLLTMIATPILIAVMLWQDVASGITVIIVLPLIPVFMILIGKVTQGVQRQQWEALQRLSTGFLDLVGGLGTLKIFGREGRQGARLRTITEDYRTRTMKVLRVSFLSGFVLELAASLSVALIAVSVGLRLVEGELALSVGLFVLLLAPEAFLPLRQVGAQFHAAADGLAAAEEVFTILDGQGDAAAPIRPPAAPAERRGGVLRLRGVSVRRGPADAPAPLDAEFHPGELTVISGPSGVGKSSLVGALQGFVEFDGAITLGDTPVTAGEARNWLAWAGQRPGLFAGTIESNVTLGETSVDRDADALALALDWAGASELDPFTPLGVNGDGLSGGQSQRVAVARAIYRARARGCHVVICDEPSSALDAVAETALIAGLRHLTAEGRIVIVVSHRPAFRAAADHVIELREASLV
ncbi:thiol reductant ABC exporter subunit CydD [Cryobacterium melibiosiphilum]|uniref:Thiol reductant ABC exporter subunit CydD n=1 Tax=Cryobacterium melibiosiphilum TaxID=995039 RepID=A0A3A5MUA5_9MICO|nr:thiol reductant ABC exporter subunit CydD [Cryobacterium melibiosiphilum]RJT88794.1 thiol reductant ABC exporter subunit CydD [Cryobacterium melibiosiphilum]